MMRAGRWSCALGAGAAFVAFAFCTLAQTPPVTFQLATQTVAGTAQYDGAVRFAELVLRKTNGHVVVKVVGDGALGGDLQALSSLQRGTLEMALMNAGLLNGIAKEFTVVDFPFLFASEDEAYAVLDGPFGKKLADLLPPKGLVGLAYPELGFRHLHNSKLPVNRVEDLRGLKIRAIQAPIYVETLSAMGANAVPLPFPDLYHMLEKKVVDGATDPLVTIAVLKFDQVQTYLTLTRHVYNPQILLVSKTAWDKLAPADRTAISDAAIEARDDERKLSRERNAQALETLKRTMKVSELSAGEEAKLREAVKPVVEKYAKVIGPAWMSEVQAALDKARGRKPN